MLFENFNFLIEFYIKSIWEIIIILFIISVFIWILTDIFYRLKKW